MSEEQIGANLAAFNRMFRDMGSRINILEKQLQVEASSTVLKLEDAESNIPGDVNLEDDFYLLDGSSSLEGNMDAADFEINNVEVLNFNTTPVNAVPVKGDMWYNEDENLVQFKTDTETVIQIGSENVFRVINKSGGLIANGTVVYLNGADATADLPTIAKADASTWEDSQLTIGLMTSDIADDAEAYLTVFGFVRGINTSGMTVGDRVYLSETTGEFTNVRPTSPAFIIDLGIVDKVGVSDGIIAVHIQNNDDFGFFNGTFMETFDCTVSSNGTVITASLQKSGGGNLTMRFGSSFSTLVTPPMTKVLTAGTATVPQANYLYILESDQTQITLSTSGYPTNVDHIKIAKIIVLTASITQNDDALANQNNNDHAVDNILMGHLSHLGEWIRAQPATYVSPGIDGNSATTDDYLDITAGPDAVYFVSTAGTIRQLHLQSFPARDNTDFLYVVNDPDAAYTRVTELLAGIDKLSGGGPISNNKYFALVFWGIQNKSGETSHIMCNLPAGQYNSQLGAENDISGYTNVDIPDDFRSTGFLICKLVIQKKATTWEYKSTLDLRGAILGIVTGAGGGSAIVSFPTNTFNLFDPDDPTKRILYDASAIATGTDRTITALDEAMTFLTAAQMAALHPVATKASLGLDTTDNVQFAKLGLGRSPSAILDIQGNFTQARIQGNQTTGSAEVATEIGNGTTSTRFAFFRMATLETVPQEWRTGMLGNKLYIIQNQTTATDVIRITTAHDVGIGMTPTVQLELSKDEGQKPTTNTWTITSDEAIKKEIVDYVLGLAELLQIRPRQFKYKEIYDIEKTHNMENTHVGLIAQEIELIVPSTVKIGKRNYNFRGIDKGVKDEKGDPILTEEYDTIDLKTFNSHDLTYVMINAIKELSAKNDALEARINDLEKI